VSKVRAPGRTLPYGRQSISDEDVAAVTAVLRSDYLTTGPAVDAFEADLSRRLGAPHAVSCSSGTAALHLSTLALGLGPGDTVIVPSITFLATANAARFVGADVTFADVDPGTGLMTGESLAEALARAGDRARAIYVVHLNGQCADMAAINRVAGERGLPVVEDACHALGSECSYSGSDEGYEPTGCGRHAAMSVFSFHPVKAIASGEGGAVVTADPSLARRAAALRTHGMTRFGVDGVEWRSWAPATDGPQPTWRYEMREVGYNYRLSDIHAALARSQLAQLDHFIAERRQLARRYDALLDELAPIVRPVTKVRWCRPVLHLYAVLIDFARLGQTRSALVAALKASAIGTQVHYYPVHRQPYYQQLSDGADLPGADSYYSQVLSLPFYVGMTVGDVDRVVDSLRNAIAS
jgi:UDP-4-amino-4,6-dideoxy-N-acetyl-beta-L-altrosamine transaminase